MAHRPVMIHTRSMRDCICNCHNPVNSGINCKHCKGYNKEMVFKRKQLTTKKAIDNLVTASKELSDVVVRDVKTKAKELKKTVSKRFKK